MLSPLSFLFRVVVAVRSRLYQAGLLKASPSPVPVIVVGNISIGGTGKTPIVGVVVRKLQQMGFRPGIVSRGYGATPAKEPRLITANTPVALSGDEPALLLRETGVPVCLCARRAEAVSYLAQETDVNIVVSDDGLQHYAMQRNIEVVVFDGQRMIGNGCLLPAGPLREPPSRLENVDIIAIQQTPQQAIGETQDVSGALQLKSDRHASLGSFYLDIVSLVRLDNNEKFALSDFSGSCVHAVAGLGNPQRFFDSLRAAGVDVIEHPMPDHHSYVVNDLKFDSEHAILMTTKDAVKVRELNMDLSNTYEVCVQAVLDESLHGAIDKVLDSLRE